MVRSFNRPEKILVLCLLSFFAAIPSFAGLKWEKKVASAEPHPLQVSETVGFKFTNVGDVPVKITALRPGCGCISGKADKKEYAPGESGVVHMTFSFGKRTGAHRKSLEVRTSDTSDKPVKLYISARIPETYVPSVPNLKWAVGEEPVPRSCRLVNRHALPISLVRAECAGDQLKIELKPIKEGHEYELVVTPTTSAVSVRGLIPIKIHPETPEELGEVKSYTIYVLIK